MQQLNTISKQARFTWIDIAKGIATLLVVYRHVLYGIGRSGVHIGEILWNMNEMVYSFRMPLFFILSGFFYAKSLKKRSKWIFFKSKAQILIYPYLLWALIQVTLQVVLTKYTNSNRGLYDYLQILVQPRAIDQLWFLYSLFNVTILYMFLRNILKLPFWGIFILSLVSLYCSTLVNEYSPIHDLFYFLIFFLTGDYFSKLILNENNQRIMGSTKFLLLALPVFVFTQWCWLEYPEMNIYLFAIVAIYGSFFTLAFSINFSKYRISEIFNTIGKNSLQIYVMHVIISSAFRIFFEKVIGVENIYFLLVLGIFTGVSIPLIVVRMSKKYPMINRLFTPPKLSKKVKFIG